MLSPTPARPGDEYPPRQCGRCRLYFEGDPTAAPEVQPDWWACPPCREILLGHGPRVRSAPKERAQVVWAAARTTSHASTAAPDDAALALLRAAGNDPATLAHALVIGRSELLSGAGDRVTEHAVAVLDRAVAFLGTPAQPHQAGEGS